MDWWFCLLIGVVLFLMVLVCGYGLELDLDYYEDYVEMMLDLFDCVKDLLKIYSKGFILVVVNSLV